MPVIYFSGIVFAVLLFIKGADRKIAAVICIGSLLALCLWISEFFGEKDSVLYELMREKRGGTEKAVELIAEADGESEILKIELAPQEYTQQELIELGGKLWKQLEKEILAENTSANYITENLYFPEKVENYPFFLKWSTDDPKLLSFEGELGDEIPHEGAVVEIKLCMMLEDANYEEEHILCVRVFPSQESGAFWRRLEKRVSELEKGTRSDEIYRLPESFEGRQLQFRQKIKQRSMLLFALSLLGAMAAVIGQKQEKEKRKKERMKQIEAEYPEMVSRMTMLVGAGMTISGAFRRIAGEYGKQRQKKEKPLYEEMLITCREMESGIAERTAYQNMGTRCQLSVLIRFTALLIQYTQSGASGLKKALREETDQALKERKERARQLGEEAGTKLLLPMTLMLVLVMMLIMVPAFTSFGK